MSTSTSLKQSCPNAATLRRFLNDEVLEAEGISVPEHIDICPICQEALERLVGCLPGPLEALVPVGEACPSQDDTMPATAAPTAPAASPVQVPGYEVLEELGRGGMGVVYKSRQLRLDRVVALKMLLSGRHAGPKERERFLREASAVAQLQHPYIVPLYEVGEHGDLPYLTLEFVSGGTLADRLRRAPLPPRDAARLVEQLARGMHYAHARGIVHRDLKPANVLLQIADLGLPDEGSATDESATPDDQPSLASMQSAIPKITDFGLAKNVAESTCSNAVCGTPSYMAPEQAAGIAGAVGPAADVYALGAILYECLTSRPPFRGPTPTDTLLQVLADEPAPPSRLQRNVPRDLETICLKCLQKKPHQRYASALGLAEDLRRFQSGNAILARPVGRWERVVKWCRRRPAVAALAAAVMALTLVAGSLVTWQWRQAVAALEEARSEKAARAQRQVDALPDAAPGSVPAILEELEGNRAEVLPLLHQRYHDEKDRLRRMRLALALLPVEPQSVRGPLMDWLLHAEDPAEVLLVRQALRPHRAELTAPLWTRAEDARTPKDERFRALAALAAYDPDDARWQKLGSLVVEHLLWANPLHRGLWTEAFRPLGHTLLTPLTEASYFPLKVGTRWHYQTETSDGQKGQVIEQIAKVETIDGQALARLETVAKGEVVASEHLSSTARGLFRHRYNGSEISPPIRLLSFPIRIGESWESEHRSGEQQFKVMCRIGSEDVEVPAGRYSAVTLHLEAQIGETRFTTTYWFAAGVGLVRQTVDGKTTLALEKFEEGK